MPLNNCAHCLNAFRVEVLESALTAAHAERDAANHIAEREREAYETYYQNWRGVSGALCDAGSVNAGDPQEVGVRELIAERDAARAERDERDATIAKLRDGINALVHRRDERERTRAAIDRDDTHLAGVRHALEVFCRAFDLGGVSCGRLCELLGYSVSDLHSAGVQAVANAITDAAEDAARADHYETCHIAGHTCLRVAHQNAAQKIKKRGALIRSLVARVRRLVRERRGLRELATEFREADARFNRDPDSRDFDARCAERDILNTVLAMFPDTTEG